MCTCCVACYLFQCSVCNKYALLLFYLSQFPACTPTSVCWHTQTRCTLLLLLCRVVCCCSASVLLRLVATLISITIAFCVRFTFFFQICFFIAFLSFVRPFNRNKYCIFQRFIRWHSFCFLYSGINFISATLFSLFPPSHSDEHFFRSSCNEQIENGMPFVACLFWHTPYTTICKLSFSHFVAALNTSAD